MFSHAIGSPAEPARESAPGTGPTTEHVAPGTGPGVEQSAPGTGPTTVANVPVSTLTPYPGNPRRGDVDAIAASLQAHGQYAPLVANRRTNHVLAGNHTLAAAKKLGWKHVMVVFVDADDDLARRIVLSDNRTSDLASYDDGLLADVLRSLPDLTGTGFTSFDLASLDGLHAIPFAPETEPGPLREERTTSGDALVIVGGHRLVVEREPFDTWAQDVSTFAQGRRSACAAECGRRLGFPDPPKPRAIPVPAPPQPIENGCESAPIDSVNPYYDNPREGDVGAIAESLARNGQYRPIVVNRLDQSIVKGNHTWAAAKALGWSSILVTWIDVDPEEARRIVLADNRTSDLASYDTAVLADILRGLADLTGTGYSGDDLDDLLGGGPARPSRPVGGPVAVKVGDWSLKVHRELFVAWQDALPGPAPTIIAERLGIPPGCWHEQP